MAHMPAFGDEWRESRSRMYARVRRSCEQEELDGGAKAVANFTIEQDGLAVEQKEERGTDVGGRVF